MHTTRLPSLHSCGVRDRATQIRARNTLPDGGCQYCSARSAKSVDGKYALGHLVCFHGITTRIRRYCLYVIVRRIFSCRLQGPHPDPLINQPRETVPGEPVAESISKCRNDETRPWDW
ncbi:unnamed protein product [Soboliphyme baturini]|uniref:Uncharacterized protein n=1 Tax=Soboliphyme baturini TaxID=241478 RepID=A0A183IN95_9BILA|nr:unnamed protein product [Soboliphyme baturini]